MFGLRLPELLVILIVTLIVFGPRNLPKLGSMFGHKVHELREAADEMIDDSSDSDE